MTSRTWLLLLLLVTMLVRLPTMFGVKRSGWDEHAYAYFAQTLNDHGIPGIQQLLRDYPTNENLKKSPLPLRIGFIVPAMLTCKVLGGFNTDNLAWFPFCCGLALVLLGARFVEQLAGGRIALVCAPLLITSPLAVAVSRRGMSDNFATLLMLGSLYLFDRCWRRRSIGHLVGLGLVLCLALLTKESVVLLYPMMALAALYYYRVMGLRASPWTLAPLIVAPLVYLMIEIWLAGGLSQLIETYRVYTAYQGTLEYTTRFEKGPWFRYLVDFFAIAPLVFVPGVIGCALPATDERRHARNLALIYLVSGLLLFGRLPIINIRLVLFLDTFLRLAASLAVAAMVVKLSLKWSRIALVSVVAVLLLGDAVQFYDVFVRGNVYNPTTFLLLSAEGFFDVRQTGP